MQEDIAPLDRDDSDKEKYSKARRISLVLHELSPLIVAVLMIGLMFMVYSYLL